MNYVNLIGKIASEPKVIELDNGKKFVEFSLATDELILNEQGISQHKIQRHRMTAWGKWMQIIEQFGTLGMNVAIEGRLTYRFYYTEGKRKCVHEVEINDVVIL